MAGLYTQTTQHSSAATDHHHHPATTAYTSVTARRAFDRPDTNSNGSFPSAPLSSAPAQQTPPPVKKVDWPQPVRDYVFRSFQPENLIAGIGNDEMQAKLKKTLSHAAESGQLGSLDWATLPLPQQLIQQERAMTSSNWNTQQYNDQGWVSLEQPDSGSKKRKYGVDVDIPPWEKDAQANGLGDRITYGSKKQQSKMEKRVKKQQEMLGEGTSKWQAAAEKRKQRFGTTEDRSSNSPPWRGRQPTPPPAVPIGPVVGTCQKLEKQYFRLNGTPKPETVRPLDVLKEAYKFIMGKWKESGNYVYTCDQFKSIRQDLTVQRIKNDFTVEVYELHARIALEMGDLGEYNQCQTQLRALYALGLGGHPAEFMAYRILYFVHTCNRTALNDILAEITPELRKEECVQHALAVRSAQASGNYHKLLAKLYQSVPNMGAYLMDMFVPRERIAAMATICRTYVVPSLYLRRPSLTSSNRYKPNVSVEFLAEELGFESYEMALDFLDKAGCNNAGALVEPDDKTALGTWKVDMSKASPIFLSARAAAFKSIDIKGQL